MLGFSKKGDFVSSFKTRGNFKKIEELWPLIPAAILCVLNIDWMVTPLLIRRFHLVDYYLLFVLSVLSTLELIFWYWFYGWVARMIIKINSIKKSIEFGIKIETELKEEGYITRIKNFFVEAFDGTRDEESLIFKTAKWGGGILMVAIGASPESGSRAIAMIFCRMVHWKRGFYLIAAGNLIHIYCIVKAWQYFGIFRMIILFLALAIFSYLFRKLLLKK